MEFPWLWWNDVDETSQKARPGVMTFCTSLPTLQFKSSGPNPHYCTHLTPQLLSTELFVILWSSFTLFLKTVVGGCWEEIFRGFSRDLILIKIISCFAVFIWLNWILQKYYRNILRFLKALLDLKRIFTFYQDAFQDLWRNSR